MCPYRAIDYDCPTNRRGKSCEYFIITIKEPPGEIGNAACHMLEPMLKSRDETRTNHLTRAVDAIVWKR